MGERLVNAEYMLKYSKTDLLKDVFYILLCSPVLVVVVALLVLEYLSKFLKADFLKDILCIPQAIFYFTLAMLLIVLEGVMRTISNLKRTIWFLLDINGEKWKVLGYKEVDGFVIITKEMEQYEGENYRNMRRKTELASKQKGDAK